MPKSPLVLVAAALAALAVFAPPAAPQADAATGVKVAIIVGATHGATPGYRSDADVAVPRGDQVLEQRRPGLQPERDGDQGQGRGRGRVGRRVHGPWQRLAEPVHVRPELHDQGRLRPQRRPQRRRQAQRLREQVLRRAVDPGPAPGAQRRRPPVPPVLRVGQLRARQRRPAARHREAARRQLRRRLPAGRLPGGGRDRPQQRPVLHGRAVHDPPDDRTTTSGTRPTPTTT